MIPEQTRIRMLGPVDEPVHAIGCDLDDDCFCDLRNADEVYIGLGEIDTSEERGD